MITIYTDGSSRGNPGPGGWSAIIFDDKKVREIGGREEHTTNNRMELTAAIKALENLTGEALVYTDSEYVMKGITEWIKKWQVKGWKTAGKKIEWKYVAGHVGIHLNERADEIATAFADSLDPALYNGPKDKYK